MDIPLQEPVSATELQRRAEPTVEPVAALVVPGTDIAAAVPPFTDLRPGARVLKAPAVTIRELQAGDAPTLCSMLTAEPVTRFIHPPPADPDGFARFIEWTRQEQAAGRQITFAIVAPGADTAAGIIQVRLCESDATSAEWGFVLAERYWGSGVFMASAGIVLRFLFDCVGLHRLEARSVALNGRGNGVLRKLGAVQEGRLRRAFCRNGQDFDEVLWTILASDWRQGRHVSGLQSH